MKLVILTGILGEQLLVNPNLISFVEEDALGRYADKGAKTLVHGLNYTLYVREPMSEVYNILKNNKEG